MARRARQKTEQYEQELRRIRQRAEEIRLRQRVEERRVPPKPVPVTPVPKPVVVPTPAVIPSPKPKPVVPVTPTPERLAAPIPEIYIPGIDYAPTPAELEHRYVGMPPKSVLELRRERIELFRRTEKIKKEPRFIEARPSTVSEDLWTSYAARHPEMSPEKLRAKWGFGTDVMGAKPEEVTKSEWERFVSRQYWPSGILARPPELIKSPGELSVSWNFQQTQKEYRDVEGTIKGLKTTATATGTREDWGTYRTYYEETYRPSFEKVEGAAKQVYDESWKTLATDLRKTGVITTENLKTIRTNLDYIRATPEKGDPTTRSNEYLAGWNNIINTRLRSKAVREVRALPKPIWYQLQESPIGKFPIVGWMATGFIKALEPIGKGIAEFVTGRPIPTVPEAIYVDMERVPILREPTPLERVSQIGGELLAMAGVGYGVGRVVAPIVKGVVTPVVAKVPVIGKVATKAASYIARHPKIAVGAMVTGIGTLEVIKIKQMYEAGYSREQIKKAVEEMKLAGHSEEEMERREKELERIRFYTPLDIVSAIGRDIGMMIGFGRGFRVGLREEFPIGVGRMAIGEKAVYKGVRVGEYPLIGKVIGRRLPVLGRPSPELAKELVTKHLAPYMKKAIFTPITAFEKAFAFKSFLPHLSPSLKGTVVVVDKAGVLRWVSPKLFGKIETVIKEGFVRQGMKAIDADVLVKFVRANRSKMMIFGSTAKELQWIPIKYFKDLPKEFKWLYDIRASSKILHRDLDLNFTSIKNMNKFISELKLKFGNKLIYEVPEIGTYKIKVTATSSQVMDIHSPASTYTTPEMAWGYKLIGYPRITQGLIKKLRLTGLGEEHIHELASHGWSKFTFTQFQKNLNLTAVATPKAAGVAGWTSVEIKQGWKLLFMSGRAKDTVRQILSGYTQSIRELGLTKGLEYYKPAADVLKRSIIAQGVSERTISNLLVEAAKDSALFYAPTVPGYLPITYPLGAPGVSPFTHLQTTASNVYGEVSKVASRVSYIPTKVPTVPPTYPSVSSLIASAVSPPTRPPRYPPVSALVSSVVSPPRPPSYPPTRPSYPSVPSLVSSIVSPPSYPPSYPPTYPPSYISLIYGPPRVELAKVREWRRRQELAELRRRRYFPVGLILQQIFTGRPAPVPARRRVPAKPIRKNNERQPVRQPTSQLLNYILRGRA